LKRRPAKAVKDNKRGSYYSLFTEPLRLKQCVVPTALCFMQG